MENFTKNTFANNKDNINIGENLTLLDNLKKKIKILKDKYLKEKKKCNVIYNKAYIRLNKEIKDIYNFSLKKNIMEIFPIIDSLEKALILDNNISKIRILKLKIKYILNLFLFFLKKLNVKTINKINVPFDPNIHEAISIKFSNDFKSNTVIFIMQTGYILHNRLLRPAMVVVSKNSCS